MIKKSCDMWSGYVCHCDQGYVVDNLNLNVRSKLLSDLHQHGGQLLWGQLGRIEGDVHRKLSQCSESEFRCWNNNFGMKKTWRVTTPVPAQFKTFFSIFSFGNTIQLYKWRDIGNNNVDEDVSIFLFKWSQPSRKQDPTKPQPYFDKTQTKQHWKLFP